MDFLKIRSSIHSSKLDNEITYKKKDESGSESAKRSALNDNQEIISSDDECELQFFCINEKDNNCGFVFPIAMP